MEVDWQGKLYMDGILLVTGDDSTGGLAFSTVVSNYYHGFIEYYEGLNNADLKMRWSYAGQPKIIIPASGYYNDPSSIEIVSVIQIEIGCPAGESKYLNAGRPECAIV